jgi:hypothetical protein
MSRQEVARSSPGPWFTPPPLEQLTGGIAAAHCRRKVSDTWAIRHITATPFGYVRRSNQLMPMVTSVIAPVLAEKRVGEANPVRPVPGVGGKQRPPRLHARDEVEQLVGAMFRIPPDANVEGCAVEGPLLSAFLARRVYRNKPAPLLVPASYSHVTDSALHRHDWLDDAVTLTVAPLWRHWRTLMGPEQQPRWHAEPEPLASDHSRTQRSKH